jgi:hypothetical protein
MLVLGINRILKWVQITTGWGTYTCPIKEINGELFFKFRNDWHKVIDFTSDLTTELISEGGKIISKKIKK